MLTIAGGIALFFIGLIAIGCIIKTVEVFLEWLTSGTPHKGPLIYIEPSDNDSQRP